MPLTRRGTPLGASGFRRDGSRPSSRAHRDDDRQATRPLDRLTIAMAMASPSRLTADRIGTLQRIAGNSAVCGLFGRGAMARDIPASDGSYETTIDLPSGRTAVQRDDGAGSDPSDGGLPVAGVPSNDCGQPKSMVKVTSGPLRNGLDMGTYYPDLVGRGYWDHGSAAGPFDTGTRAGSNVQLVGTVLSPCDPNQFTIGQSVTYTRRIVNGAHDPLEGQTFNDIAKSGRDASKAPFRQAWLDGGLNISMADPPSLDYSSLTSAEIDRAFVTTLAGPTGAASVSWSTSIRIASGAVTSNTVS